MLAPLCVDTGFGSNVTSVSLTGVPGLAIARTRLLPGASIDGPRCFEFWPE
jgi:hypothetical protein